MFIIICKPIAISTLRYNKYKYAKDFGVSCLFLFNINSYETLAKRGEDYIVTLGRMCDEAWRKYCENYMLFKKILHQQHLFKYECFCCIV